MIIDGFVLDMGRIISFPLINRPLSQTKKTRIPSGCLGGGTAVQKESLRPEAPTVFLSEAIEQCGIPLANVCVIKTSTSGNDAGAVLSLGDVLDDMEPIFYIETDMTMDGDADVLSHQLEAYWRMDSYLEHKGYTCCFIFNNYGNFLCEGNPGTLKEIHHYLYQMAAGKSNRTF